MVYRQVCNLNPHIIQPRRDAIYATKKRCNLSNQEMQFMQPRRDAIYATKKKKPYPHIYTSSSSKSGHGELISTSRHRRKYLLSSIEENVSCFICN